MLTFPVRDFPLVSLMLNKIRFDLMLLTTFSTRLFDIRKF